MDLKCRMMPPLVGSSHLCDIRVQSGRIFNHTDSQKTSKATCSLSQGSTSWVLDPGTHMQEWVPVWFIVSRNGFKRNLWTWSSEKTLARFLWWLQMKLHGDRLLVPFIPIGTWAAVHLIPYKTSNLINMPPSRATSLKKKIRIYVLTYLLLLILFYVCTHLSPSHHFWNGN